MATNYIPAGYITPFGEDIFPTTGPHLHAQVLKGSKEEDINPEFARTFLSRILVGDKKTPLVRFNDNKWDWAYPITSRHGPRKPPTAGASSYHRGLDLSIPEKTALFWQGPGKFTPMQGYGLIETVDQQGIPYKIKLIHTKGGTAGGQLASVATPPAAATTSATNVPVQQQPAQPGVDNVTYNFIYGKPEDNRARIDPLSFLKDYGSNRLSLDSLFGMTQQSSPVAAIGDILSQQPQFYG